MPYQATQAIVLRHADYREHDRVLTLLTPPRGRVDALARGCRRANSPLLAAAELFAMGEYVLFKGRGHEIVASCELDESFYALREDLGRLSCAALMLAAAEASAQPEEPAKGLFILLARSLGRLTYAQTPPDAVTCAFLVHHAAISGYRPQLGHCVRCGRELLAEEGAFLDADAGGTCCAACRGGLPESQRLPPAALHWLRSVLLTGVDKTGDCPGQPPLEQLKTYAEHFLEKKLPGPSGLADR